MLRQVVWSQPRGTSRPVREVFIYTQEMIDEDTRALSSAHQTLCLVLGRAMV